MEHSNRKDDFQSQHEKSQTRFTGFHRTGTSGVSPLGLRFPGFGLLGDEAMSWM